MMSGRARVPARPRAFPSLKSGVVDPRLGLCIQTEPQTRSSEGAAPDGRPFYEHGSALPAGEAHLVERRRDIAVGVRSEMLGLVRDDGRAV
jgi:hypothetical protein